MHSLVNLRKNFLPHSATVLNIVSLLSLLSTVVICYLLLPILFNFNWENPVLDAGNQGYQGLSVGSIAASNYNKSFDYVATYLFLSIFFVVWFALIPLINSLIKKGSVNLRDLPTTGSNVIPSSIIIGFLSYCLGLWFIRGVFPTVEILFTGVVTAVWLVLYLSSFPKRNALNSSTKFVVILVTVTFSYFSLLGLLALTKIIYPGFLLDNISMAKLISFYFVGAVGIVLILLQNRISEQLWARIMYGSQLLIPILLIVFAHGLYQHNDTVIRNNIPFITRSLIVFTCLLGFLFNLKALVTTSKSKTSPSLDNLILWPSVVSIACFLGYKAPQYSGFAGDDLHLGELILPWQQIVQLGQKMYAEFTPIHGIMDLLYGGINSILFEDTISSFPLAYTLLEVVALGLAAYLLCRLVGNGWGLVLSMSLAYPSHDRFFMVPLILILLAHPNMTANPLKWLITWGSLSLAHCFYNTSVGLALTVASLPVASLMIFTAVSRGYIQDVWLRHRKITFVFAVVALVLIWLLTPSIVGLLHFAKSAISRHTLANGIGLFQNRGIPEWFPWQSKLIWETIRIGGWLLGCFVLWHLFIRNLIREKEPLWRKLLTPLSIITLTGMLFVIAMIPWSMGRIDPYGLSRTGVVSLLMIGTLVPVSLVLNSHVRRRTLLLASIIGILFGIKSAFTYQNPITLPRKAVETIKVPDEAKFVQGDKIGLPKLGNIFIKPSKLDEIRSLKKVIDTFLKHDETYTDLTYRSALYFALDKKAPGLYGQAPIYALDANPPLIWVGPSIRPHGALSLSFYSQYRRFLREDYRYHAEESLEFLVRNDRYFAHVSEPLSDEENLSGLTRIFHEKEIQSFPITWARNLKNFNHRFKKNNLPLDLVQLHNITSDVNGWFNIIGEDPHLVWRLGEYLVGDKSDFVAIQIECHEIRNSQFQGQVFWAEAGQSFSEDRSLRFNLKSRNPLVPLGRHTQWLKSSDITHFRFDMDSYESCSTFKIDSVAFMGSTPSEKINLELAPAHKNNLATDSGGWLTVTGSDPYVVWKLSESLDGSRFNFVAIHIKCRQKRNPQFRGQIFWAQTGKNFSEDQSFVFNVTSGDLLIPLGSDPRWLKSNDIEHFRFDIDNYDNCSVFKIGSVEFMSLGL